MARPKRRRKPRVQTVYRIPVFGAVARPELLDEDRAMPRTGGRHRPKIWPNVQGVGDWSFFNANTNKPDTLARQGHNYDCKQQIDKLLGEDQDLAQIMRNALKMRDMERAETVVWDRPSEMAAMWRAATAWR